MCSPFEIRFRLYVQYILLPNPVKNILSTQSLDTSGKYSLLIVWIRNEVLVKRFTASQVKMIWLRRCYVGSALHLLAYFFGNCRGWSKEGGPVYFQDDFAVLHVFYKTLKDFISHHYWLPHSIDQGMVLDAVTPVMGELRPYSEVIYSAVKRYTHR